MGAVLLLRGKVGEITGGCDGIVQPVVVGFDIGVGEPIGKCFGKKPLIVWRVGFRREVDDGPDLESWVDGGGDCRVPDVEYFGHEVREPFEFRVFVGASFAGFLPCLEHGGGEGADCFFVPVCQCLLAVFFDERVGLGFFDDVGHWFPFLFYVDIFSITEKSQMSTKVAHRGASPHVRGRYDLFGGWRVFHRFIPACAG